MDENNRYYTMIGSRETPQHILDVMIKVASKLTLQGWVCRSGGASGADTCAELGVSLGAPLSGRMEIYLPWEGFNGRSANNRGYIDVSKMSSRFDAAKIAESIHPNWGACSRGAKGLHTRNIYQILGKDLQTPSEFVIFYAIPVGNNGQVKGGTNTAVQLGINNGCRVSNLYDKVTLQQTLDWLGG